MIGSYLKIILIFGEKKSPDQRSGDFFSSAQSFSFMARMQSGQMFLPL